MKSNTDKELKKTLKELPDNVFDGHTEFHKLTVEEKLL